ncbi:MAG TPA: hypothetical protein VKX28_33235 [Xanthobacteraceae bacterium]|jgi:hypothetical protein|nr:hypothetical protein [Xanthobacteraceae bacterium]
MTYAPRPNEFVPYFEAPAALARTIAAPKRGVLRRLFGGVFETREAQAERNAANYIARTGGRLTDEIERQITDHIIGGNWWR